MKKLALATIVAATAAAAMLAQPIVASGPLEEASGFPCATLDANGLLIETTSSHWIVFGAGKGVLTCSGPGPAPASGRAFNWTPAKTGGLCGFGPYFTANWKSRVAANGDVSLQCTFDTKVPTVTRTAGGSAGL